MPSVSKAVRVSLGAALVSALASTSALAQQETRITGRVVDATDNAPIPSAQVIVTGTTIGVHDRQRDVHPARAGRRQDLDRPPHRLSGADDHDHAGQDRLHSLAAERRAAPRDTGRDGRGDDRRVAERGQRRRVVTTRNSQPGPIADDRELARGQGPGRHHQNRTAARLAAAADPDPRRHVDLRQRRAALRGRRRDRGQRDGQRGPERHHAARAAARSTWAGAPPGAEHEDNGVNRIADINPDDIESSRS